MAKLFISYRRENDANCRQVRDFAERLREKLTPRGVEVVLDQFFKDQKPGGPAETWAQWSVNEVAIADRVLIIGTKSWFDGFSGRTVPGSGDGVATEAHVIWQELTDQQWKTDKFRVCFLDPAQKKFLPPGLKGFHHFSVQEDEGDLVAWACEVLPSAPPNPTTPSPRPFDPDEIFPHLSRAARLVLAQNTTLRKELEELVRTENPSADILQADLVQMVARLGLVPVLAAIHGWLKLQLTRSDMMEIRRVLDCLTAIGVDAGFVQHSRKSLSNLPNKTTGVSVEVPRLTDRSSVEVLKSAIADGPVEWRNDLVGGLVGKHAIDTSLEPPSPTRVSQMDQFRNILLRKWHITPDDPDAREKLEQHLSVLWKRKSPVYIFATTRNPLPDGILSDPSIPWDYLLVLEQKESRTKALPRPQEVSDWLQFIYEELDRLERKAHLQSPNK